MHSLRELVMTQAGPVLLVIAGFTFAFTAAPPVTEPDHGKHNATLSRQKHTDYFLNVAQTANAPNVARAQSKGKKKVAQADADVATDNSARTREEARLARADADYAVIMAKCKARVGAARAECLASGKNELTKAWAEDNVDNQAIDRESVVDPGRESTQR
jgi:hypothetical protein